MHTEKNGVYCSNVKIIAISKICEVSVTVYFISESQVTQPLTVIISQVVNERNVCHSFNGELDSDHYGAMLPVGEIERLGTFDEVGLVDNLC
jgi:hypothetical protein